MSEANSFRMTSSAGISCSSPYNIPPNLPVSPRVHDIKEEMDILTMSRQDSPYISSKLEQISNTCGSATGDHHEVMILRQQMISPISGQISTNRGSVGDASQSLLWSENEDANMEGDVKSFFEDDGHLHDHLIRSPPPQFPTNISAFVFPEPGSPLHSFSMGVRSPIIQVRHPNITKACSESAAMSASDSVFDVGCPSVGGHLPRRPLIRRASVGQNEHHNIHMRGHDEAVSNQLLICSKRASSGPNIIRTSGSTSRVTQSREALIDDP